MLLPVGCRTHLSSLSFILPCLHTHMPRPAMAQRPQARHPLLHGGANLTDGGEQW
jgi:hypothetical protein